MLRDSKSKFSQSETGMIPEGWESKRLGDVGEIKMCRRIFNYETKEVGAIPFYKIGTFGKEADAYISQELYNDYRQKFSFPKKGDILISAAGTIGRAIVYNGKPAYFQDSNIVWIDNKERLVFNNYLYYILQTAKYNTEGGTIQRLYNNILSNKQFICPPKTEQASIATILSDSDVLIEKLENLIVKKRAIKQSAMQELLTGKRRLPGFSGKWGTKKLGEVAHIKTGSRNNKDKIEDGQYPFFVRSSTVERINSYSHDCEAILIPGEGGIGNILHYILGRFDVHQRVYCISQFDKNISGKYVFYYMVKNFGVHAMQNSVKATVDSLRLPTFQIFDIVIPPTFQEQVAIVQVLDDMDTEIEHLEQKLAKYKKLKQGMMQALLTGRIRLA